MEFECHISGRVGDMIKIKFFESGYGPYGWWYIGTRGVYINETKI